MKISLRTHTSSFVLAWGLVFANAHAFSQGPSVAPLESQILSYSTAFPGSAANDAGSRLMQLLRSRPEVAGPLKFYLAQRLRMEGLTVDEESITNQMLDQRIQTDPWFANSASHWLLELAAEASQNLRPPKTPAGEHDTEAATPANATQPRDTGFLRVSTDLAKPNSDLAQPAPLREQPTQDSWTSSPVVTTAGAAGAAAGLGSLPVAQAATPALYSEQSRTTLRSLPTNLLVDQEAFWTLPFHLNTKDLVFVVPGAFGTALLVASDTAVERHLPSSSHAVTMAAHASTAGMAALVGTGGGLFLWGRMTQDEHQRETGFLVGEVAIDAYAASTALQYITQRERPFTGNNKGDFFSDGSSFPSNTAAVSWAAASVLAHEYPGVLTKLLAYGVAAGVTAGRVVGEKHWMSDAVIGSALGWYLGRQVYRARSPGPEINASTWGTFEKAPDGEDHDPAYMGSTYVPLDSWIYPAFDRLTALGYLPTEILAIRPWPRLECARLVLEAKEQVNDPEQESGGVTRKILTALQQEFAIEIENLEGRNNTGAQMESAYVRLNPIAGTPLRDGFDFAQTIYDDYGRPYGQGLNAIVGASGRAEWGPLAFYVRGEYQHSSGLAPYSLAVSQQIATFNFLPLASVPSFPPQNQFRTIEAYVALNVANWQLSFGQQSLFWSPDFGGSLLLSNNAEAMPMLRLARVAPSQLPGPLAWLGKMRNTIFIGRMSAYNYIRAPWPAFNPLYGNASQNINPLPYTWGDKLAIKMTPNLEIGVGLSVIWGGLGRPATLTTWLHTFSTNGNAQRLDPGKRYTGFNFSYRLPKLRDRLVLYADGIANDEPNPIAYYKQSAWNPGLYFPRLPMLPNLDFRLEGVYTNLRNYPGTAPYYSNVHYAQGYTLHNQLIGDWVGRQGVGWQATSTYWFSAQKKVQLGYRRQYNDPVLLGGGSLTDFSGTLDWGFRKEFLLSSVVQYERWKFPLLASGPTSNVSLQLQLTLWPTHLPGKAQ